MNEAAAVRAMLKDQQTAFRRAEAQLWAQRATIARLECAEIAAAKALDAAQGEVERLRQEQARLQGSLSWRLTWPLRRTLGSLPRARRLAVGLLRLAWRAGRHPDRRVAAALHARSLLRRQEAEVGADPLFDLDHYRRIAPGLDGTGLSPLRHYLLHGRLAGLTPHSLFDAAWYRATYPDAGDQEPLSHYIRHGRAQDRWPNPFFDPAWYRRQHPEITATGQDALLHFAEFGAARRYDPSPLFKSGDYLDWYADVAASGVNPLAHYLAHGRHEGRTISSALLGNAPVDGTPIEARKRPAGGLEVALLVTHSSDGRLRPHVPHYLRALRREGIAVTLIVAADRGFTADEPWLYDLVDGLYVRGNEGWDFAGWAHVLRLNRAFYGARTLYWLNDSLLGPVNRASFHAVLERVRTIDAGMVGLTASNERADHVQSFFLAFKPLALGSVAFQRFVLGIRSLRNKEDVINAYEIRLAAHLRAAGISTAAVFGSEAAGNAALWDWRALLDSGFPFLKVAVATGDPAGVDWREALRAHGYDVSLADRLLAEHEAPSPAVPSPATLGRSHRPPLVNDPPQLTFIGPFNYANGLGVAARGYLAALMHLPLPANILPIERPFHIHGRVAPTAPSTECVGPADLALVHLNPDAWDALLTPAQVAAMDAARRRVGLFVWESQDLPASFATVTRRLSAVWVPSRYCADAFRRVSEAPVHVVPYAVRVQPRRADPARVRQLRQALGIASNSRVVLFSFDASSYLQRKNPHALVRAFGLSGLAGAGWRLVLKTKHLDAADRDGRALLELAERTAGTVLLNRPVGAEDAFTLLDMADIYASPHASEGFGLTIAEAMALGKPVVASDFGGSTDFLDDGCGFPVRCTPWQLRDDEGAYPQGTTWGRIDEDGLADALTTVASLSAPALAEIGGQARRRIRSQFSPGAVAARMRVAIDDVLGR